MRALVTHYPRKDLAGTCVAIVVVIHDLPDETVREDQEAFQKFTSKLEHGRGMPGRLFEVRQVWQLAGQQPRLIEATVELTDQFVSLSQRHIVDGFFPDATVHKISADVTRGGHFEYAGGGTRRGIIWCDRSMGIGEPRPWSAAYRVRPLREFRTGLAPDLVKALKRFVIRF